MELNISEKEQFEAIKQAGECGNITAMMKLAEFYEKEIGTEINSEMTDYWYQKARTI